MSAITTSIQYFWEVIIWLIRQKSELKDVNKRSKTPIHKWYNGWKENPKESKYYQSAIRKWKFLKFPLKMASYSTKLLGINLFEDFQDNFTENCGTLLKEIKENQIMSIFIQMTNWYKITLAKNPSRLFWWKLASWF